MSEADHLTRSRRWLSSSFAGIVLVGGLVLSGGTALAGASGAAAVPGLLGESAGAITVAIAGGSQWAVGDYLQVQVQDLSGKDTIGFSGLANAAATDNLEVGTELDSASDFGTLGPAPVLPPTSCVPDDSAGSSANPTCDTLDIFFKNNGTARVTGESITLSPVEYDLSTLAADGPLLLNSVGGFASGGVKFQVTGGQVPSGATATLATTSTSIGVTPSSSASGSNVVYSATVSSGASRPGGTVSFATGTTPLCTATLLAGFGSCAADNAPVGTDTITGSYSGDGSHLASSGSSVLTVTSTCLSLGYAANAAFVCQAFADLLARLPSPSEDAYWSSSLISGTSRAQVAYEIASSQEYREDLVGNDYKGFLGRAADPGGLAYWVDALNSGTSDQAVLAGILGSPEFYADSGRIPALYVAALYQELLGRAPDATGAAFWESQLSLGTSPSAAAAGILGSSEYLRDYVTAQFSYLLGRLPDPAGLSYWVAELASGGSPETVVAGIIGSEEYFAEATA